MVEQLEMKRRKEEIIMEKKLENALEIISMLCIYWKQYNSKHCWQKKGGRSWKYLGLKSKSARLAAGESTFSGGFLIVYLF